MILFFILTFFTGWAHAELVSPAAKCVCDTNISDHLENPSEFNFGAFTGECIDSCRFRKTKFLNESPTKLTVSNVLHMGHYYQARIPLEKAETVSAGFEEFIPGVFHVFLVFQFSDGSPVILTPQEKHLPKVTINNLVLSSEGVPPKEGKYNLLDAYMGRYLIGVRLLSREEVVRYSVVKLKHEVHLYPLQMTGDQARALLREGLDFGEKNSFKIVYQLFSNNCATNVLDLVKRVTGEPESHWWEPLERALPIAGPFGTLQLLASKNLIDPNSKTKL